MLQDKVKLRKQMLCEEKQFSLNVSPLGLPKAVGIYLSTFLKISLIFHLYLRQIYVVLQHK